MFPPVLLVPKLVSLIDRASAVVMEHYAGATAVTRKADDSPVTAADHAAEQVILEGLAELTPGIPVVAEEEAAAGRIPDCSAGQFWLVDPLDGTKEFISKNGEFTVNIALIDQRLPILGVVAAPARGIVWWGAVGHGAVRREGGEAQAIKVRAVPAGGMVAVASRSHRGADTDAWLAERGITDTVAAGSSLKFCLVAEGKADVYPRLGTTMEWDTAAGHAVLRAAGGRVREIGGSPLLYHKPDFRNPHFVAEGGVST